MNRIMMIVMLCLSANALAQNTYESGISTEVDNPQKQPMTAWLLEQQRRTGAPAKSELPTPLYVESQNRLVNSFKQPIPESLNDRANSRRQND